MASRIRNRRELRQQVEQAAASQPAPEAVAAPRKAAKAKGAAAPVPKKARKKVKPRLCARWGVFDSGMKQLAIFDYNQRAAAEKKAADLRAKKSGVFFLQLVKGPMPESPDEGAPG
jgi:hypothetical protein